MASKSSRYQIYGHFVYKKKGLKLTLTGQMKLNISVVMVTSGLSFKKPAESNKYADCYPARIVGTSEGSQAR